MSDAAGRARAELGVTLAADEAEAAAAAAAAIAEATCRDAAALPFGAEPPDFRTAFLRLAGRGDGHGER